MDPKDVAEAARLMNEMPVPDRDWGVVLHIDVAKRHGITEYEVWGDDMVYVDLDRWQRFLHS